VTAGAAVPASPAPEHVPVLRERALELFAPAIEQALTAGRTPTVVDATLGLGGHTQALLTHFPDLHVIGIDRDTHALAQATARLAPFADRLVAVHAIYDEIDEVLETAGVSRVDGFLFDLGVSSMQLDRTERGFSYSKDAPLDMRMDDTTGPTAADVLNTASAQDLARILREYGEEKFARRIAADVVRTRETTPFERSSQLVAVLDRSIPAPARRTGGHPAKRTFQALRIAVNDELRVWERALPAALGVLNVGGRVVVMSYQSLEDRITKRIFAEVTTSKAPRDLPIVPAEFAPKFRLVTRGAEKATEKEIQANQRAKPVRLRVAEKIEV
jgi:16S rRNA (cytosine1402-N4)-methyltransferase